MKNVIRLFIADDHQMFIDGIKALLSDIPHIRIVGEATDGNMLLEKLETVPVDLILMDIGMPGMNGIEAMTAIAAKHPALKVIALTMYDDTNRITKMIKAGAKGYILKNTSKSELLAAIETLAAGSTYYSRQVAESMMKQAVGNTNPVNILTKREIEIILLIVKSMTNKEIADQLSLSEFTVNTHRKNAMQKLEIRNTAGLVKFALDNNLAGL